ncbi:hypothetical protein Ga0123461_0699 [Mariprofundus aestuarium]|uniref:Uncharacterized protein n=1 Tax=Mariprofundus aestuarium TaxID=1921086 RepID=A0A2K8KW75_MARES|nr:hypothetical protein [Mariprofundus aestuarium]ATX79125.1 hypothetical protein Ga0123461_0699 [Mariprofundus aestuarium]
MHMGLRCNYRPKVDIQQSWGHNKPISIYWREGKGLHIKLSEAVGAYNKAFSDFFVHLEKFKKGESEFDYVELRKFKELEDYATDLRKGDKITEKVDLSCSHPELIKIMDLPNEDHDYIYTFEVKNGESNKDKVEMIRDACADIKFRQRHEEYRKFNLPQVNDESDTKYIYVGKTQKTCLGIRIMTHLGFDSDSARGLHLNKWVEDMDVDFVLNVYGFEKDKYSNLLSEIELKLWDQLMPILGQRG